MRSRWWYFLVIVGLLGCSSQKKQPTNPLSKDFFPVADGSNWTYRVKIGEIEPLVTRVIFWQNNGRNFATTSFGHLPGLSDVSGPSGKEFQLTVAVCEVFSPVPDRIPIDSRQKIMRLSVFHNGAGVYGDSTDVLWTIEPKGLRQVTELVTFTGKTAETPAVDSDGIPPIGYSKRVLFFMGEPGESSVAIDPNETLTYVGLDGGKMHFRREVKAQKNKDPKKSEIAKGYTEDTWFQQGIGLVRLEQKIDGQVSMTWELEDFGRLCNKEG